MCTLNITDNVILFYFSVSAEPSIWDEKSGKKNEVFDWKWYL